MNTTLTSPNLKVVGGTDVVPEKEAPNKEELLRSFDRKMAVMTSLVKGVAKGRLPGTVISGPHGIGKSYLTFKILETYEALTIHPYKGQTTPLSLYNNLLSASEPGNIVVFDDNDSVFNDQVSLDRKSTRLNSSHT